MERSNSHLHKGPSAVLRYGLAFASVAIALATALLLQHYKFNQVELPLFLFAVALTAWHSGVGAAIVSIVLSILCHDYFFLPPFYTLYLTLADVPSVIILVSFAVLITWFSSTRRRVEGKLRQARDRLELEVEERTQQASLLNLTHDSIFVRDLDNVIRYWNRGAEELYGLAPEHAIGRRSHELLRTVYPAPIDGIRAELMRTGRWEGELTRTKADGNQVVVASRWSLRRDEH